MGFGLIAGFVVVLIITICWCIHDGYTRVFISRLRRNKYFLDIYPNGTKANKEDVLTILNCMYCYGHIDKSQQNILGICGITLEDTVDNVNNILNIVYDDDYKLTISESIMSFILMESYNEL